MHILFLSHYFPPEVNAPATRTYEHCRRWVAAGHRVTVITCAPNCPTGVVFDGYRNAWRRKETVDGIRVLRVWTYIAPNKGFLKRIANFLSYLVSATLCAMTVRGVDVIVATSPQFFCGWAGVLCGWLRRRPFVLEVRDIWPESIVTVGAIKSRPARRILEWLEHWMYAAARRIVTVGDGYRARLLERGVPPDKIAVIPNGVDTTQFVPRPPSVRLRTHEERKFVCAYVGTVGMAHGLDVVLRAAQKLKRAGRSDVVFWIVGDGAERSRLQSEAQSRRLDSVRFVGLVPKTRMPETIAACDACLVHLKEAELFETVIPSKIFEIMAMSVPIIMGVRGQAREIVLAAGGGLPMTPEDEDSLIAGIDAIETNREAYCRGRRYVAEHFDRNFLARRMLDELTALAGRSAEIHPAILSESTLPVSPATLSPAQSTDRIAA
ncbi:MAG TPA: glycosyltransferase family 4 protein [Planctomycetaceae bacterium]|jgi:glycosyltransferase involved in cell wall biosynthesis|nr:glycosyltransferase family 4 protein [Planctomycetaceae bacterium]